MASLLEPVERLLRGVGHHALELLFPPLCAACGKDVEPDGASTRLCCCCLAELSLINSPACLRCSAPLPTSDGVALDCPICNKERFSFDATVAAGWYQGLLRDLILRAKTDRTAVVAHALAELLVEPFADFLGERTIDVATPAPMHRRRQWQRGVHATSLICNALAGCFALRRQGRLLKEGRHTPPPIALSRVGRVRNVRATMAVGRAANLRDRTVLLVDDVMTTAATSSEAARVLKKAGAREVVVAVVARTKDR